MNVPQQKAPRGQDAGRCKMLSSESRTHFSCHKDSGSVKLTCGLCYYYTERRRKFCAFLGETVRAEDDCRVHPDIIAGVMP